MSDEEKIMQNFYGFWFLVLEIPMGVTQFFFSGMTHYNFLFSQK